MDTIKLEHIRKQHDIVKARLKLATHHCDCLGGMWDVISPTENFLREMERAMTEANKLHVMTKTHIEQLAAASSPERN